MSSSDDKRRRYSAEETQQYLGRTAVYFPYHTIEVPIEKAHIVEQMVDESLAQIVERKVIERPYHWAFLYVVMMDDELWNEFLEEAAKKLDDFETTKNHW